MGSGGKNNGEVLRLSLSYLSYKLAIIDSVDLDTKGRIIQEEEEEEEAR